MGISGVGQPSSSPKHLQRPRRLWAARPASRAGPWTQAGTRLPAGPHHCGPHGPSLPTCHQEAAAGLVPQGPWEEALRGPPRTGPFPSHSPVCSCRRGQGRTPRFLCSDPQSTAGSPLPGSAVFWGCTQGGGHLAGSQTVPTARTLEGHALMRAGSQDAGGSGGVPSTLFPSGTQRLQRHKLQAPATCSGPAAPGPTPGPSGPRATDAEQSPRSRGHAPPGGWGQGRNMWSEATCHVPASAGKSRRPARSPQGAPGPRTAPRRGRRFRRQPSGRDSQVHG